MASRTMVFLRQDVLSPVRQFAVRAGLVDGLRKLVGQHLRDLVDRDIVLGGELPDDVASEHLLQLIR